MAAQGTIRHRGGASPLIVGALHILKRRISRLKLGAARILGVICLCMAQVAAAHI